MEATELELNQKFVYFHYNTIFERKFLLTFSFGRLEKECDTFTGSTDKDAVKNKISTRAT
jgi:hypothetical protein